MVTNSVCVPHVISDQHRCYYEKRK